MSRDLDGLLAAIDGALGDADLPDAMRWAPNPEQVEPDGAPIYAEDTAWAPITTRRGGIRYELREPVEPELRAHGLVEVVLGPTPIERLAARQRVIDRADADRARAHAARVRGRRHPTPRGPAPDGQLTLDAPLVSQLAVRHAADHEAALAHLRGVLNASPEQLARMGDLMRDLGLGLQRAAVEVAKALTTLAEGLAPQLDHLRTVGLLPDDGPTDPRARALWLRQHRSTGPEVARAQLAHRPRRHR